MPFHSLGFLTSTYSIALLRFSCLVFILVIGFLPTHSASSQNVENVWHKIEFGDNLGRPNLSVVDIDGNGVDQILYGNHNYFALLDHADSQYEPTWISKYYDENPIYTIELANLDGDSDYEIYVALSDGLIEVYDGATLALENTWQTNVREPEVLRLTDVDNDSQLEIALLGDNTLEILDAATLEVEWDSTFSFGLGSFEVGDTDGDGMNELVLSDGTVLDGSSKQIEWTYEERFGTELELIDLNNDAIPEIVAMNWKDYIRAFDGSTETLLWDLTTFERQDAFHVADIDGDGSFEIIFGNTQWGSVFCYNADTQELLWEFEHPEHGISNISVGDPDNDGENEVVWGAGYSIHGADYLYVVDRDGQDIEWINNDFRTPFAVAVTNNDEDEALEIITAGNIGDRPFGLALSMYDGINHHLDYDVILDAAGGEAYSAIAAADLNRDARDELILASNENVIFLEGESKLILHEAEFTSPVTALAAADIDNDAVTEIIVGEQGGYITILDGETYEPELASTDLGQIIQRIQLIDMDDDDALEVVILHPDVNYNGMLSIYDGASHQLESDFSDIRDMSALDIADLDRDGIFEVLIGDEDGNVSVLSSVDYELIETIPVSDNAISSIVAENLDDDSALEIIVGSSTITLLSSSDYSTIWQSDPLGLQIGQYNNLIVTDVDNDQLNDILFTSSWGFFQLESTTSIFDFEPPYVTSFSPAAGLDQVSLGAKISIQFSELLNSQTLNSTNVGVTANESTLDVSLSYIDSTSQLTVSPDNLLPPNSVIEVSLSSLITDVAGNKLDGNGNGVFDDEETDTFAWTFSTGAGADSFGPRITNLMLSSDSLWAGVPLLIEASASDSSESAISTVTVVEGFIDAPGTFGTGIPFSATDDAFDSVVETVQGTLRTDSLQEGWHTLLLHGQDSQDNWGAFAEISFYIQRESPSSWTMLGQNAQHTGANAQDSIQVPLMHQWARKISEEPLFPVAVVNNQVFVSAFNALDQGARLLALEATRGDSLWQVTFEGNYKIYPPSFGYGNVYLQANNRPEESYVFALDARDGHVVWQSPYATQAARQKPPTLYNGKVFVQGGYFGGMYAYDAFTGREIWFKELPQFDRWTPAVYNDIAYAFLSNELVAIDVNNGNTIWAKSDFPYEWSGSRTRTSPVVDVENMSVVASSQDNMYVVDLENQDILWATQGVFNSTPAIYKDELFAVAEEGLIVYDRQSGDASWRVEAQGLVHEPVISRDYIFVASDTVTYAIGLESRSIEWQFNAGGPLTVANNTLYIAGSDGMLHAFIEGSGVYTETPGYAAATLSYALHQNYPNPFNPRTTISYTLPVATPVLIELYTMTGQLVQTIEQAYRQPGTHAVSLDASELSSGVYFYRMTAGSFSATKTLVLIK